MAAKTNIDRISIALHGAPAVRIMEILTREEWDFRYNEQGKTTRVYGTVWRVGRFWRLQTFASKSSKIQELPCESPEEARKVSVQQAIMYFLGRISSAPGKPGFYGDNH